MSDSITRHIVRDVRRQLRKKVETGHGMTTVPDGYEEGDVEITINFGKIAMYIGADAFKNKSGKAICLHGAVEVRVIRRETFRGAP